MKLFESLKTYQWQVLTLSLCILILITLLQATTAWRADWKLAREALPTITASSDDLSAQLERLITKLPDQHLFGQTPPPVKELTEVPISSLQLKITGIVKTEDAQAKSKVLISAAGQPSKVYVIGDSLPQGVTIHDITDDAVVLENHGKLEKLLLPRTQLEFKPRETRGIN